MPSKVLGFKTSLQALSTYVSLPTVWMLPPHIVDCVAFVHLHKNQRKKLDPCAICCLFLGYAAHQKGYRCYDPVTKHIYVTMDVTFLESDTFYSLAASNFSLQGETQVREMNWLTFDWFKDTDATPNTTRLIINQESKLELTSPEAQPIINQESNLELTSLEAEVTVSTSPEAVIVPPTPTPTLQYPMTHLLRISLR